VLKYNGTSWVNDSDSGITGSGTAGQVAYFTGATTQGGSNNLFWDNTNARLGVGTNNPSYTFHAISSAATIGAFRNSGAAIGQLLVGNTAADMILRILASGDSLIYSDTGKYLAFGSNGGTERVRIFSNGNFGINTGATDSGQLLQVAGTARIYGTGAVPLLVERTTATSNVNIEYKNATRSFYAGLAGNNNFSISTVATLTTGEFQVASNGNVLINTSGSDTGQRLQVVGTTLLNGNVTFSSATGMFWDATNSRLGIGTNTPSANLDVKVGLNSLKISGRNTYVDSSEDSLNANIYVTQDGVGDFGQLAGNLVLQARTQGTVYRDIIFAGGLANGDALMTILGEGNVLIGSTTDSGEKLQVTGTMKVTGATSIDGTTFNVDATNDRVGIGTATPSYRLHIAYNGYAFGLVNGGTVRTVQTFVNSGGTFDIGVEGSAGGSVFTGASAYASVLGSANATSLQFATNSTVRATLDASGNLGLGVTPSAWGTTGLGTNTRAIEISQLGSSIAAGAGAFILTNNAYVTNAAYIYARSSLPATQYAMNTSSGQHQWFNAPSGTAGNAITFTQAMTLDASGNLGINTTTVNGSGASKSVSLNSSAFAAYEFRTNNSFTGYAGADAAKTILNSVAGYVSLFANNSEGARLTTLGNFQLGSFSADSGERLQVTGTAKITGATTFGSSITASGATINGVVTINSNIRGLLLSRTAVTNYNGIGFQTGSVQRWFVGLRENLSSDNFIFYSENIAADVLTLNVNTGAATFSSSVTAASGIFTGNLTVDTNTLFVDATNNRVGVNMTPSYALDVTGSARVSDAIAIGTTPDTNNPFKILKNLNTTVGIKFENTNTSSLAFSAVQLGTDVSGGTKFTNLVYASSGVTASGVYNPDGTSLINNGNGGLNFLGNPIRMYTGGSNGVLRWDISNEGIIQYNATSPTTSTTDAYKQYSADVTAGNAAPHFRTENGAVIKLYQETNAVGSAFLNTTTGATITDTDTFDGYTLQQVVKALRNLGILQ
jgi:hypothetical protein